MLNPAIYSAHLKLHPLMVLSTLVVAEHNMGVWGLLLAVPMTVFALDYLIRYPQSTVTEVGAKELEKVCDGACVCVCVWGGGLAWGCTCSARVEYTVYWDAECRVLCCSSVESFFVLDHQLSTLLH
jgi:hypothetical protein